MRQQPRLLGRGALANKRPLLGILASKRPLLGILANKRPLLGTRGAMAKRGKIRNGFQRAVLAKHLGLR